jgi:hypothetical protein
MRSFESHNTFYEPSENKISPDIDLFQLPKEEQKHRAQIKEYKNKIFVQNYYNNRFRELIFDQDKNEISIKDHGQAKTLVWNFIFHPKIKLKNLDSHTWAIYYNSEKIFIFTSSLEFKLTTGFYSQYYGKIEKCHRLVCARTTSTKTVIQHHIG